MNVLFSQTLKTDLGIYPPPTPPALPASGGKITDVTFGTTILRVTDEADGKNNYHAYSYWPCFNADNSMVYVYRVNGAAKIYNLDTATFSISNKRNAFQTLISGEYPLGEDQVWSRTDKNILYCHTYQRLVAYNVKKQTYKLLKDFSGIIGRNEYLVQMSCNDDATKFAFSLKNKSSYKITGYVVWDAKYNTIYQVHTSKIDEVQLDKTGGYLWIKTTLQGAGKIQCSVFGFADSLTQNLTDNKPDYAPGHGDTGPGFIVGYENWENRILYRTCNNPHTFKEVWDFKDDWSQDTHLSLLSSNTSWVLASAYVANAGLPSSGLFENEIFQVTTDGTMQVRRLCHHQSNYISSGNNYWASPRASISYDGKFIMFTSNWGNKKRTDVFILKIPPAAATPAEPDMKPKPGKVPALKIYKADN